MYNPYANGSLWPQNAFSPARCEVVRVNGKGGAEAFQMAPNASILLLDETAPIVWLKTTDGAGYPTLTPYDIAPHKEQTPVDTRNLEERIARLEAIVNESHATNAQAAGESGSN